MDLSNENVIHIKRNGFEYLQFKKLNEYPEIKHAYALKPLDFRRHKGNDVVANYKMLFNDLNISIETLVKPTQEHTNNVKIIDLKVNKNEPDIFMDYLKETDGLITNKKEITLASTNADCILFLIYDPVKKVISNVHSGWRGTFQKIVENSVKMMIEVYGSNPKDIIVCIAPSIRKCHFEVDEDVKEQCENIFEYTGRTNEFIEKTIVKDGKQKYVIDTVKINKIVLSELEIDERNIIDSNICSYCFSEKVHSRRGDGLDFGLGSAIISMVE